MAIPYDPSLSYSPAQMAALNGIAPQQGSNNVAIGSGAQIGGPQPQSQPFNIGSPSNYAQPTYYGTTPTGGLGNINFNSPISPYQVPIGTGNTTGDMFRNLINQSLQQGNYGQNAILGALNPVQQFGGTLNNMFSNAAGQQQNIFGDLPSSVNWSGQAATGDLSTQNQLVQQLLGQTTPTAQGIQSLLGQGLGQSAQDMLNAVGGRITNPLQTLMGQISGQPGLATRAEDMLNAIAGGPQGGTSLQQGLQQQMGLFGQGLTPATQAALQTQAADTTAAQYNNARQSVMTQLLNSGAMGGDVNNSGAGTAQIVNELGGLANAQQQQQSQLQQQGILANQNMIQQNYQNALAGTSLTGQIAQGFTGLEQGGADIMQQLGLGAAQTMGSLGGQYTQTIQNALEQNANLALGGAGLTGNLASSLGGLYGQGALGFGGLTNNLYNTSLNSVLPYLQGTQTDLSALLGGSQALGQMGLQGVQGVSDATGAFAATATGNSGLLGSILGAVGSLGNEVGAFKTIFGSGGSNLESVQG